jgi:thioredoxin-related protein
MIRQNKKQPGMNMKQIMIIVALVWGLSVMGDAQEKINWYSIEEAVALNANEPRVMVVDVYTDWCGWCKRLDATTFADPEIASILNQHFYPVKLNAEGKENIVLGNKTYKFVDNGRRGYHEVAAIVTNGRLVYPTISYLSDQGKVLKVAPGYQDAASLKIYLAWFTTGAYKDQGFEEFRLDYTSGQTSRP